MAKKAASKKSKKAKKTTKSAAGKSGKKVRKQAEPQPHTGGTVLQLRKELYFPTQIYFCDIPQAEKLNAELLEAIYSMRESDPDGIVRSNVKRVGSWHSATDLNTRKEFQDLVNLLTTMVQQIYKDLGYHPDTVAVCDNMWANVNPRYGYNRFHSHPNVLWSGVYYIQAPPNAGRLYFRDPREQAHVLAPSFKTGEDRVRELWSEVYYEPIAGRAILFPGWLGHEVEPNLTEEEAGNGNRISISFNFLQRAKPANPA